MRELEREGRGRGGEGRGGGEGAPGSSTVHAVMNVCIHKVCSYQPLNYYLGVGH